MSSLRVVAICKGSVPFLVVPLCRKHWIALQQCRAKYASAGLSMMRVKSNGAIARLRAEGGILRECYWCGEDSGALSMMTFVKNGGQDFDVREFGAEAES